MGFLAISVLADKGMDLSGLSRSDLRRMAARHASELPTEFEGMAAMVRWAESGGKWPRIKSDHPAYFYCLRATNTPNRDLVNMLLAELTPLDFRQLFICHKEAFYQQYRNWPEAKKDHVAAFLAREYAVDKAGARAALFGHEPDMSGRSTSAQDRPKRRETESLVERVGPWGAVSSRSGNRGRR